ncbi:MAG: hypothetical protein GX492_09390 [Firmicutes bacterium]|nr:hypothetical protein [Bacillota bacterium]
MERVKHASALARWALCLSRWCPYQGDRVGEGSVTSATRAQDTSRTPGAAGTDRAGARARHVRSRAARAAVAAAAVAFISCIALLAAAGAWGGAAASAAEVAKGVDVSGEAVWSGTYAAGDPEGLKGMQGYAINTLIVSQTLRLTISGELPGGFSVSASLDNYSSGNLQLVRIDFSNETISGCFGDFAYATANPYVARRLTLRGVQVAAKLDDFTVGAILGRVKGIPASKTFKGASSSDTTVFRHDGPYAPTRERAVLVASIGGAESYRMSGTFDPDFMKVELRYDDGAPGARRTLLELLTNYDMAYLYRETEDDDGVIAAGDLREVDRGKYTVVTSTDGDHLVLQRESLDLLRDQVRDLIREYNTKNGLTGPDQKVYPFVVGSDSEKAFLEELCNDHSWVVAGLPESVTKVLDSPLENYATGRFYLLGHERIDLESVEIEVLVGGTYTEADAIPGLLYTVYYDQGVIEFTFPAGAPDAYEEIRVRYNYSITGNIYTLGISVAQGSERVYLNGELLKRDIDYTIDYEAGVLFILRDIGPQDTIKVEYEYFAGGLGVPVEYKRIFYGVSWAWQPTPDLKLAADIIRAQDQPTPLVGPERARTMPNTHTVAGVSADAKFGRLTVDADVAYSHEIFPYDDNSRKNTSNRINEAMFVTDDAGNEYMLFAHQNGLTSYRVADGKWRHYSPASGLAGWTVYDMAASAGSDSWFFATESGLTVLAARVGPGGEPPFDRVENWRRYYESDGLPSSNVLSVLVDDAAATVWVGTDSGLARASVGNLENWRVFDEGTNPEMISEVITDIAVSEVTGDLYVGTPSGLMSFDGATGRFTTEFSGAAVAEVAALSSPVGDGDVYVATDSGVRFRREPHGAWQVLAGTEGARWSAVRAAGGVLWLGGEDGLYEYDGSGAPARVDVTAGREITAVAGAGGVPGAEDAVWAGEGADEFYRLSLWSAPRPYASFTEYVQENTKISGKDEHRYADVPADEHTYTGFAGALGATFDLGAGKVYGSYERVEPTFLAIGARGRQDLTQFRLGGSYTVWENLTVRAEHAVRATRPVDITGEGSGGGDAAEDELLTVTTDSAGLTWNLGPQVDLDYTLERMDRVAREGLEAQRTTYSIMARESLFATRLTLGAGYEKVIYDDNEKPRNSYIAHNVKGDVTYAPVQSLTLRLYYRFPVRVITVDGTEKGSRDIGATVSWADKVGPARMNVQLSQYSRTDVPQDVTRLQRRGTARATFDAFQVGTLKLTPSGGVSWDYLEPVRGEVRTVLSGDAGLRGETAAWRTDLRLRRTGTTYHESEKVNTDSEVSTTATYTGFERFTPSAEASWKTSSQVHPTLGEKTSDSLATAVRLRWLVSQGATDTLSGWRNQRRGEKDDLVTYGVGNSFTYSPGGKLSTTVSGSLERTSGTKAGADYDETKARLDLTADWRFSDVWRASLTLGYIRGVSTAMTEGFNTYTGTLKIIASF